MAKTVDNHWKGTASRFDGDLSTGFPEGVETAAARARARGYRNPENLSTMGHIMEGKQP